MKQRTVGWDQTLGQNMAELGQEGKIRERLQVPAITSRRKDWLR